MTIEDQGNYPLGGIEDGMTNFETEKANSLEDFKKNVGDENLENDEVNGLEALRETGENYLEIVVKDPKEDYTFITFQAYGSTKDEADLNIALLNQLLSTFQFK